MERIMKIDLEDPTNEGWWLAQHTNIQGDKLITAVYFDYTTDDVPHIKIHGPVSGVRTSYFLKDWKDVYESFIRLTVGVDAVELTK